MLDGADFVETFRLLHRDRGFAAAGAFGIALRLHRSGGFAKDAIYLRGLLAVSTICAERARSIPSGSASSRSSICRSCRSSPPAACFGLRRSAPRSCPSRAGRRLEAARAGISPLEMVAA